MIRNIEPILMVRLGYIVIRLAGLGQCRLGPAVLGPPVVVRHKEDVEVSFLYGWWEKEGGTRNFILCFKYMDNTHWVGEGGDIFIFYLYCFFLLEIKKMLSIYECW